MTREAISSICASWTLGRLTLQEAQRQIVATGLLPVEATEILARAKESA